MKIQPFVRTILNIKIGRYLNYYLSNGRILVDFFMSLVQYRTYKVVFSACV